MDLIYLDHNATTPILPEVSAAMAVCHAAGYANPASQHQWGRKARQVLEDAREGIARLLGVDLESAQPHQLIFASGGTEANNLAIFGMAGQTPGHVVISAIEHPSVAEPSRQLERRGWQVDHIGVTRDGVIDLAQLQERLRPDTRLVSLMLGNNETGVLQPVAEAACLCQQHNVPLHTDAVQVVGKLPVSFRDLDVAAMTVAAHKFHGPVGIGLLALRHGQSLVPQLWGGFQQAGLRPGTEPLALVVGMRMALEIWHREQSGRLARITQLRDQLETLLLSECPELVMHGRRVPRLPHTSNIGFPGVDRQALVIALDLAGIACSTGSACASGSSEPSPTLVAMGVEPDVLKGSLRFSLGCGTTSAEVALATQHIIKAYKDLRMQRMTGKKPPTGRVATLNLLQSKL